MPLRAFNDRTGVHWEVWEAHATLEERRANSERREAPREVHDRRHTPPGTSMRASERSEGWLVFRCDTARRRHQPIPRGWERMPADELEALMSTARPSGPRSRVVE